MYSGAGHVNFAIGIVIAVGSMIGGYSALGGHLEVLVQPFEFLIICGASLGVFIIANTFATIKDCGKAFMEAILDKIPKPRDFLDVLSVLHALMRELRAKSRSEVESHFDNPKESEISSRFPSCSPTPTSSRSFAIIAGSSSSATPRRTRSRL